MKLLELAPRPDDKQMYRSIAAAAKAGSQQNPPLSAPVQLWDAQQDSTEPQPTKEGLAKLAAQLRSGLASIKDGRYNVLHVGSLAYVSVNTKPLVTRTRAAKKVSPPAPPTKKAPAK